MACSTTYRLEIVASGFADALSEPFSVDLYAVDVDIDTLVDGTEVASEYGESVLYGYDASTARATVRRMNADGREGREFGG